MVNNIKYFIISIATLLLFTQAVKYNPEADETTKMVKLNVPDSSFYQQLKNAGLTIKAYELANKQFTSLSNRYRAMNDSLITIVDFSQPSDKDRFFIVDVKNKKIITKTLVAHGMNTGSDMANYFSNDINSHKSSLGFYLTDNTYYGKHGYSLRLDGLEKGINDNARKRAIVIHGANYVSENFIQKNGRLGRSFGCPALSYDISNQVIDLIKGKTCLFIYHDSYALK